MLAAKAAQSSLPISRGRITTAWRALCRTWRRRSDRSPQLCMSPSCPPMQPNPTGSRNRIGKQSAFDESSARSSHSSRRTHAHLVKVVLAPHTLHTKPTRFSKGLAFRARGAHATTVSCEHSAPPQNLLSIKSLERCGGAPCRKAGQKSEVCPREDPKTPLANAPTCSQPKSCCAT